MKPRGTAAARQSSLLEEEAAEPARPLFFALWPDAAVRARLAALATDLRNGAPPGRDWIAAAKLHATLHYLELPTIALPGFRAALPRIVARLPRRRFVWSPDRIDSFHGKPGHHPCILRGASDPPALQSLWERLREGLILEGYGRQLARQSFTPHITLAYLPHRLPEPKPVAALDWDVDRLALLQSAPGGAAYPLLAEWPLD